ncbi:hypothetical protein [Pseudorhodobacter aquimaris]|uniref:hypothetical protein n=1 Tax=Pseudorhodobacter aquimaris TaxID=687412 RepID=UPI0012ECF6B2|nr:hypothetical protein [Pseudorhodobacter aquimaris]
MGFYEYLTVVARALRVTPLDVKPISFFSLRATSTATTRKPLTFLLVAMRGRQGNSQIIAIPTTVNEILFLYSSIISTPIVNSERIEVLGFYVPPHPIRTVLAYAKIAPVRLETELQRREK